MRMLRAYCEIGDLELRRALVDLAERCGASLQPAAPRAAQRAEPVGRRAVSRT
jgi:hypothetical protein